VLEDIERREVPALKAAVQSLAMPADPVEKDLA
jgi:hypothetical protein